MPLWSISFVALLHGIAAMSFAAVFLIEGLGYSLPLLSLQSQHPDFATSPYATALSFWVAVAIGTFATYEMFFIPFLSAEYQAKLKTVFVSYHLAWCLMITYCALLPGSMWSAWISVVVMYGFTIAGALAPATK